MGFHKRLLIFLMLLFASTGHAQKVTVITYAKLENMLSSKGDTILIVNFWATWCTPCVKELPYFEQLQVKYAKEKIKVIMISLDYNSLLEKKVKPFIEKTGINLAKVFLLNEPDPNAWMGKVAPEWSGALPFTLILNGTKERKGYERPFTFLELETELKSFIQ